MSTVKLVVLMKRNQRLSLVDFMAAYESRHAPFARTHVSRALRYERRYLSPLSGAGDFDVLTELWYADREAMNADLLHMASPDVAAAVAADEEDLFERETRQAYMVVEEAGGAAP